MSTQRLTKKQKKALAFRQRKHVASFAEDNSIPVMEDQDAVEAEDAHIEDPVAVKEDDSIGSPEKEVKKTTEQKTANRKRKREEAEMDEEPHKPPAKQRFILFVGNLKYTTTKDSIAAHFAKCDPPPVIRLLAPKTNSAKPNFKSKGCAFLEFTHRNALQQALKLHHSELEGRNINVELTAGGGGKGQSRMDKLKDRNKNLFTQRHSKKQSEDDKALLQRPQRFSITSGIEQPILKKRTWTVGDSDDGQTHRGGKQKGRGKKSKNWGTGANLIPVG